MEQMDYHRKVFQLKSKSFPRSVPSIQRLLFSLFLISAFFFLLLNCGGERGGPSAPTGGAPSQAEEVAAPAAVSGTVETLSIAAVSGKPFRVEIFDKKGNKVARGETDEKGKIDLTTIPIASGFYLIQASREGDPIVLESAVPIQAGQKAEMAESLQVNPETTLARLIADALDQSLGRTADFYTPIMKTIPRDKIEKALAELNRASAQDLETFLRESNALREILQEVIARIQINR